MDNKPLTDTIAAIATPHGCGGIGVVRVSGAAVPQLALTITKKNLQPRKAELVEFYNPLGNVVDIGLAILFPAPHSFTGEDVLELHGHGGVVVLALLLEAVVAFGARIANPGEFSARAFENNKIDLAQAEAIADLISAQSKQAAGAALRSLQGNFSAQINSIVSDLTTLRIKVEAAIDFPEDADYLGREQLPEEITAQLTKCQQVLAEAEHGQLLASGLRVVVLGEPNVGKSSLLNLLSGEDTAIVTNIPGTTRDILQAQVSLSGIRMDVLDTAGIRESADCIEQEGIRRAWLAVDTAQIIILMLDGSVVDESNPRILYPEWVGKFPDDAKILVVVNKIDLLDAAQEDQPVSAVSVVPSPLVSRAAPEFILYKDYVVVKMSAKTGLGKQQLEEALSHITGVNVAVEPSFIARKRHVIALQDAAQNLQSSQQWLQDGAVLELVAEELRLAQQALAAITGEFTADDLLGRIFSEFCIGK